MAFLLLATTSLSLGEGRSLEEAWVVLVGVEDAEALVLVEGSHECGTARSREIHEELLETGVSLEHLGEVGDGDGEALWVRRAYADVEVLDGLGVAEDSEEVCEGGGVEGVVGETEALEVETAE